MAVGNSGHGGEGAPLGTGTWPTAGGRGAPGSDRPLRGASGGAPGPLAGRLRRGREGRVGVVGRGAVGGRAGQLDDPSAGSAARGMRGRPGVPARIWGVSPETGVNRRSGRPRPGSAPWRAGGWRSGSSHRRSMSQVAGCAEGADMIRMPGPGPCRSTWTTFSRSPRPGSAVAAVRAVRVPLGGRPEGSGRRGPAPGGPHVPGPRLSAAAARYRWRARGGPPPVVVLGRNAPVMFPVRRGAGRP